MPKIVDVKDHETGETLKMAAIDAKEAVDNDPKRYSMKGYSKQSEEPQDPVPRRAKPAQPLPRARKQGARDADLSATSGEPDKHKSHPPKNPKKDPEKNPADKT